jgi:hypothetical protein
VVIRGLIYLVFRDGRRPVEVAVAGHSVRESTPVEQRHPAGYARVVEVSPGGGV